MSGDSATLRRRRLILPVLVLAITVPNLIGGRAALADTWPLWREMLVSALLLVAGAAIVAAVAVGIVNWRREHGRDA